MTARYGRHEDTYTSTVDGAAAHAAQFHAVPLDPPEVPTPGELAQDEKEREAWLRQRRIAAAE